MKVLLYYVPGLTSCLDLKGNLEVKEDLTMNLEKTASARRD